MRNTVLRSRNWSVLPEGKAALLGRVLAVDDLRERNPSALAAWEPSPRDRYTINMHGVAIFQINGVIAHNSEPWESRWLGVTDGADIVRALMSLAKNRTVKSVVLSMNSPGGHTEGLHHLARKIRQLARLKPVVAHTSGVLAEGAYLLANECNQIVATRNARIGSVELAVEFCEAVRTKRNCCDATLNLGQGALEAKLIDRIGTLGDAIVHAISLSKRPKGVLGFIKNILA